ncbi:hypothetical protein BDP67DRAFT_564676 [Colletotrichum lupini]|nr:hypothetical protein BDP67DRAFT_564676 [Colletotrichum lupini]
MSSFHCRTNYLIYPKTPKADIMHSQKPQVSKESCILRDKYEQQLICCRHSRSRMRRRTRPKFLTQAFAPHSPKPPKLDGNRHQMPHTGLGHERALRPPGALSRNCRMEHSLFFCRSNGRATNAPRDQVLMHISELSRKHVWAPYSARRARGDLNERSVIRTRDLELRFD